jgi:integrase
MCSTAFASLRFFRRLCGARHKRHTFCSHLAMRGAPARAIQALAGHQNLTTTEGYMHMSPAAIDGAIRLLDQQFSGLKRVESVEI